MLLLLQQATRAARPAPRAQRSTKMAKAKNAAVAAPVTATDIAPAAAPATAPEAVAAPATEAAPAVDAHSDAALFVATVTRGAYKTPAKKAYPRAGGLCRAVWDYCDELKAQGIAPTVALCRDAAPGKGWNVSNAAQEFYAWRKYWAHN